MTITGPAIKLGIFLAVSSLITSALFVIVGDLRFGPTTVFRAQFMSASGLRTGDDVKVAGVVVGKVTDVDIVDSGAAAQTGLGAEVRMDVDSHIPVTTTTNAYIRYKNLIGDRYLELKTDPGDVGRRRSADSVIPVSQTKPALDMDALVNGFKPLLTGVNPEQTNKLSAALVSVLNGRTADISDLITQMGELGETIADRDATIGSVVTDLNTVLVTVADRREAFGSVVVQLQELVSELAGDRRLIADGLTNIAGATTELDELLSRARPDLTSDIEHLRGLAQNLNSNTSTINMLLAKMPEAYRLLGRSSGYGSFVNFFVCGLAIRYPTLDGGHADTPMVQVPARRCK
ncbi:MULTISPECIES: MCE family protein [Gordonia]|jgi:phospholipid/cholesterol/gamma-HCH transport system substrate-binding protein|uniref:MCE family protein n=6 Tax=Gordonia TaxID=2053 RepID=A0AAW6RHC1_GORRU|nr:MULTISPECIES: MCE family protein [Gordonia]MDY6808773.1 MCE family protein [Actinomycetota bacterium]ASR05002.1 mce related protein [Gordonia rubripertincta]EON30463.1 Mce family protein [Gordonia terrae C-6]MAU84332.1 mammalian cell entry protein [Gordonia sp. (in: high G+C Gram-positive bacteria)]MCR8900124.1 MCE family protein [Gordonia sp. GONU]